MRVIPHLSSITSPSSRWKTVCGVVPPTASRRSIRSRTSRSVRSKAGSSVSMRSETSLSRFVTVCGTMK